MEDNNTKFRQILCLVTLRIPDRKSATCITHYVLRQYETSYKVLKEKKIGST